MGGESRPFTPARYASNRKWILKNKHKWREYERRYVLKYPNRYLHSVAKHRAKKKGIEFSITQADVFVPTHCPILGIELVIGVGSSGKPGGNPNSASLDRIDPTKGYVPGNVRVISHQANSMKGAATQEELRRFAFWVLGNV